MVNQQLDCYSCWLNTLLITFNNSNAMTLNGYGSARILYPDELDELIDSIPYSSHKVLATLLRFTGARCTEAAKSKWKNYNGRILMLPKTDTKSDRSRPLPICNKLKLELDLWKQHTKPESDEEFIFKGRFPNSHLKRQSFDKALRKYSPFGDIATHTFRRSVLTEMKRQGIPLDVICKISGHSNIRTLEFYLGVSEQDLHAAVGVL